MSRIISPFGSGRISDIILPMKALPVILLLIIAIAGCSGVTPPRTEPADTGTGPLKSNSPAVTAEGKGDEFYQVGIASWYGGKFNGRRTSNGEIYDMYKLTAAHKELPFNTIVEVENLRNRRRVIVRINDRGPFVKDRIIDLSYKAAIAIEMDEAGTTPVALRIVDFLQGRGGEKVVVPKIDYSHRSRIYLQAGAFSVKENAESLAARINYYSRHLKFRVLEEKGLNKVVSEIIKSRTEAENLKKRLEDYGFDTFIKEEFIEGDRE